MGIYSTAQDKIKLFQHLVNTFKERNYFGQFLFLGGSEFYLLFSFCRCISIFGFNLFLSFFIIFILQRPHSLLHFLVHKDIDGFHYLFLFSKNPEPLKTKLQKKRDRQKRKRKQNWLG